MMDANCIHAVTQALLAEGEAGKTSLTRLLERFSRSESYKAAIVEAGGIAATVQLMEDGTPAEQHLAATVLKRLAGDEELRSRLLQATEVVPGLVGMVEDSTMLDTATRATAAEALERLVNMEVGQEAAQEAGVVHVLLEVVAEDTPETSLLQTNSLKVLQTLCQDEEMRGLVVEDGGIEVMMEVLTNDMSDLDSMESAAEVLDQLVTGAGSRLLEAKDLERLVIALRTCRSQRGQLALMHALRVQVLDEECAQATIDAGIALVLSSIVSAYVNEQLPAQQLSPSKENGAEVVSVATSSILMACKCISAIASHKNLVAALHEGGVAVPLISLLRESRENDERIHAALALERMVCNQRDGSAAQDIVSLGGAEGMFELLRERVGGAALKVALTAIRHMALHRANLKPLGEIEGGIELLVELLERGSEQEQELAARALWNLAFLDTNHQRIATGLRPMIHLLRTGSVGAKQASAKALSILAVDDEYSQRLVADGCIEPLVEMLHGSNPEKEAAAGALANIAYDEESRQAIANAGAIEPLLQALELSTADSAAEQAGQRGMHNSLTEMACQCLENLAFSEDVRPDIATPGAMRILLKLVKYGTDTSKVAALGAITNLATNDSRRLAINAGGGIEIVVNSLANARSVDIREASAKSLWNLSYCEENRAAVAEAGGVELLVTMLSHADNSRYAVARALWNLAYTDENRQRISAAGGVRPLVSLLSSDSEKEREAATKAIVNLTLNETIRGEIAAAGAIQPLGELLLSPNPTQRAAAARALTNLAMNSRNRQDMQNTSQILPALVRMLKPVNSQMSPQTQKEVRQGHLAAAKALRNIVADEGPRQAVREEGAVVTLQALLEDESTEKEVRDALVRVWEALTDAKARRTTKDSMTGLTVADRSSTQANLADKQ